MAMTLICDHSGHRIAWELSQGDWPSVRTVAHHFGSLATAIEAAGLTPRARASQHADRTEERAANRRAVARLRAASLTSGRSELADRLRDLAGARKAADPVALH